MLVSDLGGVKWLWPFMHVIEAQERHDKSPKKDNSSSQMRLLGGTPHV